MVRFTLFQQLLGVPLVEIKPLGLPVGTEIPSYIRALIPVQPQPPEIVYQALLVLRRRPLDIGIFDPEHEYTVFLAGKKPVEQSGPHVSNMEKSSRAGSEPNS
ncbi:hypothetical protein ES703_37293 [subsurface metagenome]